MPIIEKIVTKPAIMLCLALLIATAGVSGAQVHANSTKVYTWVDERGVTHFSATPPDAGKPTEAITVRTSKPMTDADESPALAGPAAEPPARSGSATHTASRQRDQARCDQARETVAALAESDRVQVREQNSDEYRALDLDELEEWRERAREDVRRSCR